MEYFLKGIFQSSERLISQMDRLPVSETYGCFHRNYWHFKTFDFPSSIYQMGVHSLALLYELDVPENPFFKRKEIKDWIFDGFDYTLSLQNKDGSFDEWYPNERGWAGPTGYLLHSLYETYKLFENDFPKELKEKYFKSLHKSAHYLISFEEADVLANHYAIALLPIYEAYILLGDEELLKGYQKLFIKFSNHFNKDEGWFTEYDGVDIGYLGATISFLARLHKLNSDQKIEKMVGQALTFYSYFCGPKGSFIGHLGSRQTQHTYPYGIEYWKDRLPLAQSISKWLKISHEDSKAVFPKDQDDHYLFYRFPEYIEAFNESKKREIREGPALPFEETCFDKWFQKSGIYVTKSDKYYFVANLQKGGAYSLYSLSSGKLISRSDGWAMSMRVNKNVTSNWVNPEIRINISDKSIFLSGSGHMIKNYNFTPFRWIQFRVFMLIFGQSPKLAKGLKKMIRSLLIVGRRKAPIRFEKSIAFQNNKVVIEESIFKEKGSSDVESIYFDGLLPCRYVPQSRYFQTSDMEYYPKQLDHELLNKEGQIRFIKEIEI